MVLEGYSRTILAGAITATEVTPAALCAKVRTPLTGVISLPSRFIHRDCIGRNCIRSRSISNDSISTVPLLPKLVALGE